MMFRRERFFSAFFLLGAGGFITILSGCYAAFLTDASSGLASGRGTDPVLDVTVLGGELEYASGSESEAILTGDVVPDDDHLRLLPGGVLDFRNVIDHRTRGVTVAFRVRAVVSESPDVSDSCLVAFLYRPGSPERLSSILQFGNTSFGDDLRYDVASWRIVNGACDPVDEADFDSLDAYDRCRVPTASASTGDAFREGTLDIGEWRWVVFTIDRNMASQFLFGATQVHGTALRRWFSEVLTFDHTFGRLAFVTSTSCEYRNTVWGGDQEFAPVRHTTEFSSSHPRHVYGINSIRVFDYALTARQMQELIAR